MHKPLLLCLTILFLAACNSAPDERSEAERKADLILPDSNGGRLDIMVVAEDSLWNSRVGDKLRKYFIPAQAGLPQPEARFNIRHVSPKNMSTLLKRSRNIVMAITEDAPSNFAIKTDMWARPQNVVYFSGSDEKEIATAIEGNATKAVDHIHNFEVMRLQKTLTRRHGKNHKVLDKHHISMKIPLAFEVNHEGDDFVIYWNRTKKTDQGIIVHFKPMTDEVAGLGSDIIPMRDSITKLYVHGQTEGSYMVTEDLVKPDIRSVDFKGNFAFETRGLWRTEGEIKGGPFISYTIYDEDHQQIITVDGFIFGPQVKKRSFVLELEAILKTLTIVD